jgi:hypothetical protein
VDLYREATLRPRVRDERGVVGDGDRADDGQSEAVVVVDAGAVESLEGLERRWTCSGGITGPVSTMETMALSPWTRVEISTRAAGLIAHGVVHRVGRHIGHDVAGHAR